MKVQSFIEALLCEFAKISDGIWCVGVEELDDHITLGGFDGCCCHKMSIGKCSKWSHPTEVFSVPRLAKR